MRNISGLPSLTAKAETLEERYASHNIKVLSLSGYAQSGKDTAAQFLVDKGWKRLAFADVLKQCVLALDPLIPMPENGSHYKLSTVVDIMGMEQAKLSFPEVRRLLQVMGTEVGRQLLGNDVWVDKVVEKFEPNYSYVVTDTRFDNEFSKLRDLGAVMVWVERPGVGPLNNHASESSLLGKRFDIRIENNGSLDELRSAVLSAAEVR